MLAVRVLLVCTLLLVRMERMHGMYGTCNAEHVRREAERGGERGREGENPPHKQTYSNTPTHLHTQICSRIGESANVWAMDDGGR